MGGQFKNAPIIRNIDKRRDILPLREVFFMSHKNKCEGECTMEPNLMTFEKEYAGNKVVVTDFPVNKCCNCDEIQYPLINGVMVELFAQDFSVQNGDIHVDFSEIQQKYAGEDIISRVEKMYKSSLS